MREHYTLEHYDDCREPKFFISLNIAVISNNRLDKKQ